jgi:hypothetical protein
MQSRNASKYIPDVASWIMKPSRHPNWYGKKPLHGYTLNKNAWAIAKYYWPHYSITIFTPTLLKSWLIFQKQMSIDIVFSVYVNAMWDLYVKNNFQFNKQNQKRQWIWNPNWKKLCDNNWKTWTICWGKRTNIFLTSWWKVRDKVHHPMWH